MTASRRVYLSLRERIVEILTALKEQFGFQQLIDLCGADYPDREERFEVVYHLLSLTKNARVRVKLVTGEATPAGGTRNRNSYEPALPFAAAAAELLKHLHANREAVR